MRQLLDSELPHTQIIRLTLLLGAAALPHFNNLATSVMVFFFVMLGIRLWLSYNELGMPRRWLKVLLTLIGFALVFINYRSIAGHIAGGALLTLMLGLKTMELQSRRDLYLTLFLCYFLIITQFLFSQGILLTLYLVAVVWGLTALMVSVNHLHTDSRMAGPLKTSGIMLLQALPTMVILFIIFPRLDGPLWSMRIGNTAQTGLSNQLSPGSFDRLIQSPEIAFRVMFDGPIPPPEQRYWRGPVMWHTDGRKWEVVRNSWHMPPRVIPQSPGVSYKIILEPSTSRRMPVLDLPAGPPPDAMLTHDFQAISHTRIHSRRRYDMVSHTEYRTENLSARAWEQGIQLPDNITPRMRQLVQQWQRNGDEARDVVNQALDFFRNEEFYYTLEPPLLQQNPTDQFLFESRRGFCEHYASSFATLMRIAEIPTRIVAGYQGGEFNELGNYLIVRQSDAHAWTEVWLDDRGWTRVDPTGAVAPERIQQGIDFDNLSFGEEISFRDGSSDSLDFIHRFNLLTDAISARWEVWIISYNNSSQSLLLANLGLDFIKQRGLILLSVLLPLALLVLLAWGVARRNQLPKDPVLRLYHRFCSLPQLRDLPRSPDEGPRDYARRLALHHPTAAKDAEEIANQYIDLRYGGREPTPERMHRLKSAIKDFRLK
jgi:transglutaminase-like putative cysteine protease